MTDSVGGQGQASTHPDTEAGRPQPTHPATEAAQPPTHPATELAQPRPTDEVSWDSTATVPGPPRSRDQWAPDTETHAVPVGSPDSVKDRPGQLQRRGPGVPRVVSAGQIGPTAHEVWRTGLPVSQTPPRRRWRRWTGSALTVALLVAVGVVIFLRLHHPALRVTGVAITSQIKDGCSVDVTGRIGTTGGAGTVSYQWVLTPQTGAPHPLSQSVTSGQTAIYITAAIQSTGRLSRQVTLQVLGPGEGSATAHVIANC